MKRLDSAIVSSQKEWPALLSCHWEKYWKESNKTILLLTGELGAGKTALVRALGELLGIPENINSPTFNLCNIYESNSVRLLHYDLYRLSGPEELSGLDFEERWFSDKSTTDNKIECTAIEWWQKAGKDYFQRLGKYIKIFEYKIELLSEEAEAPRRATLFCH